MNLKKKSILTSMMILFVFSSFSLATAAEGWGLEEGEDYYYYVEIKEAGEILAKGIVSFAVDDITSTSLRFSITADFSGPSAITYRDIFEDEDDIDFTTNSGPFPIFDYWHPSFFTKEENVEIYATWWQGTAQIYIDSPNYTVDANFENTEWYFKIEHDETDYLMERDIRYTSDGILKFHKVRHVDANATYDHEYLVEKSILPFKNPIAVPNLYVYIGAGALGLIIIVIISAIFRKKKR